MNGATLPPWLSPWAGGLVYGQRVYKAGAGAGAGDGERLRPRLTIYTLGHDHSAPILGWSESGGVGASAAPAGAGGAGRVRWERVPLERAPWHVDLPAPARPDSDRPPLLERAEAEGGAEAAAAAWGGVLRGWAAGAALLAVLVVLARVAEHCLDLKYLLRRRRMQREWQRASVRATCRTEEGFPPEESPPARRAPPPPPPYSELAPGAAPKVEEPPPPPYAERESCVRYINKRGIPVLVYSRARAALDPAGRRRVERILRAAGLDLASLGAAPPAPAPAPAPHHAPHDPAETDIDFTPTSVISIITSDDEVETCLIGAAPKHADVQEGCSNEDTEVAAGTAAATADDVAPVDASVAV